MIVDIFMDDVLVRNDGVLLLAKPYRKHELAKMIRTALTA
jgi:hypothetical protein